MTDVSGERLDDEPTSRIHHRLYLSDIAWIEANVPKLKRSYFVRQAVRQTIRKLQAKRQMQVER